MFWGLKKLFRAQSGRSMVEMLGVLAIIGVLSVGGIAGYHKAMFKYRLNKQAEQLNQVINTIVINVSNFNDLSSGESIPLMPYLIKLGEIPTDMINDKTKGHIYDVFNSSLHANIRPFDRRIELYIYFGLTTKGSETLEVCRNMFNVFKENSSNIYYLYSMSGYLSDDQRSSVIYGDLDCKEGRKCLKNISLQFIEQECSLHWGNSNGQGHFAILWKT